MPMSTRLLRTLQAGLVVVLAGSMLAAAPRLRGDARRDRTQGPTTDPTGYVQPSRTGPADAIPASPRRRPDIAIVQIGGRRFEIQASAFYNMPGIITIDPPPPPALTLTLNVRSIDRRPSTPRLANFQAFAVFNDQRLDFPIGIVETTRTTLRLQGTAGVSLNDNSPQTIPVTISIPDRGGVRIVTIPNVPIYTPLTL